MMRSYERRDRGALKVMLDAFPYNDRPPDSFDYTGQYLENLCAVFGGRDYMETLKSFLRTYNHISGVFTERGMMVDYERTGMSLRSLPKLLWRKAIPTLGLIPVEPHTFDQGKSKGSITVRTAAPEALPMFDFLAPATIPTTLTWPSALLTSRAFLYSINPTARATSPALTSITSLAPRATTASTLPTAPTTTSASSVSWAANVSSTPATPKTHNTSLASTASTASPTVLASPAPQDFRKPFAPAAPEITTTIPMAAKGPSTTVKFSTLPSAHSLGARQGTIRAGQTVQLGKLCVVAHRDLPVRRHCFVQPKHHQEASVRNRQLPDQQH